MLMIIPVYCANYAKSMHLFFHQAHLSLLMLFLDLFASLTVDAEMTLSVTEL